MLYKFFFLKLPQMPCYVCSTKTRLFYFSMIIQKNWIRRKMHTRPRIPEMSLWLHHNSQIFLYISASRNNFQHPTIVKISDTKVTKLWKNGWIICVYSSFGRDNRPSVNFINVKRMRFSYKTSFRQLFLVRRT